MIKIRAAHSLLIFLIFLCLPFFAFASSKIGQMDFENNLNDPYGRLMATGYPTGTHAEAEQIVNYVPGIVGMAARSSHNNDDGAGDLEITHLGNPWPASNELYEKFWIKYEPEYWGVCSNGIWNVKWLWTLGSIAHTELVWQSYSTSIGRMGFGWQLNGGGTGWDGGTVVTKWPGASYNLGDWMQVEIYMKLSSGETHMNPDGIMRLKINDIEIINESDVATGVPGPMRSPALKASCDCETGKGWWQIDEYEVWDGLPPAADTILPAAPTGLLIQ